METQYLSTNWLDFDESVSSTTADTTVWANHNLSDTANVYITPTYTWPYTVSVPTKIRMKLSEVEHIRKLCKNDRKLRKAMKKMAPYIEVEVDFPGGD